MFQQNNITSKDHYYDNGNFISPVKIFKEPHIATDEETDQSFKEQTRNISGRNELCSLLDSAKNHFANKSTTLSGFVTLSILI